MDFVTIELEKKRIQDELTKLREALTLQLDLFRLVREGKPVPWEFAEKEVKKALGLE